MLHVRGRDRAVVLILLAFAITLALQGVCYSSFHAAHHSSSIDHCAVCQTVALPFLGIPDCGLHLAPPLSAVWLDPVPAARNTGEAVIALDSSRAPPSLF